MFLPHNSQQRPLIKNQIAQTFIWLGGFCFFATIFVLDLAHPDSIRRCGSKEPLPFPEPFFTILCVGFATVLSGFMLFRSLLRWKRKGPLTRRDTNAPS